MVRPPAERTTRGRARGGVTCVSNVSVKQPIETRADEILDVVVELLEEGGYDAVTVRAVASRARVSLATIYTLFGSRDELVIQAMERWLAAHVGAEVGRPAPDEPVEEWLVRTALAAFDPWQRSPVMLRAMLRAQVGPGGERLARAGVAVYEPLLGEVLVGLEPGFVEDLGTILEYVLFAAFTRFAAGEITVDDVAGVLARTLFRLFAAGPGGRRGR